MSDKKISELTNITGANLADTDEFVVVDTSASETKAVTRAEFFKNTPSIGIGTSSPSFPLDVDAVSGQFAANFTGTTTGFIRVTNDTGYADVGSTGNNMLLRTNGTERMRIDSSGNLLVGTTTQYARFNVSSDVEVGSFTNTSGTGLIRFRNSAGSTIGYIQWSGSSTSYVTSSDYRLKEDVQPMVGASDRVLALKPVNFAWKVDGSRVDGFLAHEAQTVVPEAVTGTKDAVDADGNPVYQGIDQSKLVPLLTAALQEALVKIEALEARITVLEA